MNNKILVGVYVSVFCLSLAGSTVNAASKTPAKSKTTSVKGANTECLAISKTLQKAQNATQLQSALKTTGKNKIKACASYLQNQKSLTTTLNRISKQEISKQQALLRQLKTKPPKRATPSSQLKINQRINRLQSKAQRKIQAHKPVKKHTGKRLVQRSPVAKITKLTPATVAPGANIVIEGSGFGDQPGTVQLRVNGRPIDDASIDSWEDGWRVKSYTFMGVHSSNDERCNSPSTPFLRVGHGSLESRTSYFNAWFQNFPFCNLEVTIEGPVGIESGMEDWRGYYNKVEDPKPR